MRRSKLSFLTIVSAFMLSFLIVMWVRSIFCQDRVGLSVAGRRYELGSSSQRLWLRGSLSLINSLEVEKVIGDKDVEPHQLEQLLPDFKKNLTSRCLCVPYWMLMLPTSILPLRYFFGRRGRRKRRGRLPSKAKT